MFVVVSSQLRGWLYSILEGYHIYEIPIVFMNVFDTLPHAFQFKVLLISMYVLLLYYMQYRSRMKKISKQIIKEPSGGISHNDDESIRNYLNFHSFRSTLCLLFYNCIMTFSFKRNLNFLQSHPK